MEEMEEKYIGKFPSGRILSHIFPFNKYQTEFQKLRVCMQNVNEIFRSFKCQLHYSVDFS